MGGRYMCAYGRMYASVYVCMGGREGGLAWCKVEWGLRSRMTSFVCVCVYEDGVRCVFLDVFSWLVDDD